MHSLQYHIAMLVMRYKKWTAPPPGVDGARSRQDMQAMGRMFSGKGNWQPTPLKIGELDAEWVVAPGGEAGRVVLYLHESNPHLFRNSSARLSGFGDPA